MGLFRSLGLRNIKPPATFSPLVRAFLSFSLRRVNIFSSLSLNPIPLSTCFLFSHSLFSAECWTHYLDRNVQVLFPVRLLHQSQGILWMNSSVLAFLEAACCRETDMWIFFLSFFLRGKERLSGRNLGKK